MAKQKHGTTRETSLGKTTMSNETVPIVEVRKSEEGSWTTTEGSKEQPCKLDKEEEEKKALQELAKGLEQMSVKQNECVTTPKEEHNAWTLKRRRTLENNDARDGQAADMKVGDTGMWYQSSWLVGFSFWIRLGIVCPSHMFYFEIESPVTFLELMEFDLCWKYSVLSFSLLHHAYLRLKECMHSSTCVMFCIKLFQKNPYYLVRGRQNFQWQSCKKIAPSNPNWLEFEHCKVFGVTRPKRDPES